MRSDEYAALVAAHRRGDLGTAIALARELASAGSWNRLVAATLVAHGPGGDPVTDRALVELVRIESVSWLAGDPASQERWRRALAALIGAGRTTDAVVGVRLAAAEGRIEAGPWKVLIALLIEAGHHGDAIAAGRLAAEASPCDAELQAMRALLACECGELDEAAAALERAHRLASDHPMVCFAQGRLALARGDRRGGAEALEIAHTLGADREVVGLIQRLGWVGLRYGV
jgi:tetratricopeptide (TPR) repeat protein